VTSSQRRPTEEHPSVELIGPDGDVVRIDREIAPLIHWLWHNGMETFNSCQDNHGYVWIEFGVHSAEAFLDHIKEYGDETLKTKCSPFDVSPMNRSHLKSLYDTWDDTWLIAANADTDDDITLITISIRFPREHLPLVMKTCE
jgi:hypothetical protein